jgi:hypothetical protein
MLRRLLSGAGAALGLFHVWLFGRQAMEGALASPGLLLKWLAAFGLAAALVALRRKGVSLVRGRKAVAVWVLAALLHAPAIGERVSALDIPAVPEAVLTFSELIAPVALLTGLLALLWIARPRAAAPLRLLRALDAAIPSASWTACALAAFSPRPPPSV